MGLLDELADSLMTGGLEGSQQRAQANTSKLDSRSHEGERNSSILIRKGGIESRPDCPTSSGLPQMQDEP